MPCYSAKDDALVTKVTAPYYSKDHVRHRVPSHLLYFNASTGDVVAVSTLTEFACCKDNNNNNNNNNDDDNNNDNDKCVQSNDDA